MTKFLIVDGHNDTILGHRVQFRKFASESKKGHIDLPRLKKGNVQAMVFALCPTRHPIFIKVFTKWWFSTVNNPDNELHHIKKFNDFEAAKKEGKIGAILSYEGAGGIDKNLDLLRESAEKGLKQLNVTWANVNKFGTGAKFKGEQIIEGLTNLGRDLVMEAQKLGVTIDVSHLNDPSFWNVIEIADKPVIASHSNSRAVCNHPRNLTDDQIKAIHEKGGTVGINFGRKFLDPEHDKDKKDVPIEIIKRHIDHIVEVTDINTVALGADYDGTSVPICVKDCTKYPDLMNFLLENGYSEQDVQKISHQNLLRAYKDSW
ncbi:MAG: dipeptidase [Candidatus Hodarchaeota archaeon]